MFATLEILQMSSALARHAGQRQAIVAQNVANSDTPAYVPRDLPPFESAFETSAHARGQRATRENHLNGSLHGAELAEPFRSGGAAAPNGNQVSLETEMLKSVAAKREHDRALAIYKTALNVLRGSLRKN